MDECADMLMKSNKIGNLRQRLLPAYRPDIGHQQPCVDEVHDEEGKNEVLIDYGLKEDKIADKSE